MIAREHLRLVPQPRSEGDSAEVRADAPRTAEAEQGINGSLHSPSVTPLTAAEIMEREG